MKLGKNRTWHPNQGQPRCSSHRIGRRRRLSKDYSHRTRVSSFDSNDSQSRVTQRLEGDGLLQKNSSRIFIVRKVDLKEYLQSLRVRETLEPKAAFLATGNIAKASILKSLDNQRNVQKLKPYDMVKHWNSDCEVHDLFIRNCGNEVMTHILLRLRITTELFEIDRLSDRLDQVSREHEKILDALLKDDAAGARRAVKSHIRSLFGFALQAVG